MSDMDERVPSWRNRERRRARKEMEKPKPKSERLVHKDKMTPIKVGDAVTIHLTSGETKDVKVTAQTPEYIGKKKGDLVLVDGAFVLIEHVW